MTDNIRQQLWAVRFAGLLVLLVLIYLLFPTETEAISRCLRSRMQGHTTHLHWQVWTGGDGYSGWVDTMKEC